MSPRKDTPPQIKIAVLIPLIALAVFLKAPILVLLATILLVTLAVAVIPNKSAKKKAVAAPKKVKIPGVGEIEWITDPRQLEAGGLLSRQALKQAEDQLLYCSPGEWIEQGERVAVSEEEAANKPQFESAPSQGPNVYLEFVGARERAEKRAANKTRTPSRHNAVCQCRECKSMGALALATAQMYKRAEEAIQQTTQEIHVFEKEEPIATYSRGGIIKFAPRPDFTTRYKQGKLGVYGDFPG